MTEAEECSPRLQCKVAVNAEHLSSALLCKLALQVHQGIMLFLLLHFLLFPFDHTCYLFFFSYATGITLLIFMWTGLQDNNCQRLSFLLILSSIFGPFSFWQYLSWLRLINWLFQLHTLEKMIVDISSEL